VHPVHPSHPAHPEHPVAHTAHPAHPASVSHPVHPAASSGKSDTYTVHSGDTLSGIASQHHLSLSALEKDNPQIKNLNLILPGQILHLGSGINSAPSPSPGLLNHSGVEAHPGTGGWARPIPNASAGSQPQYDLIGFFIARPDTAAMYV
jgi:hypothetical protein